MGALTTAVFVVGTAISAYHDASTVVARTKAAEAAKATPSCGSGMKVVAYRFVGEAGTKITYNKKSHTIPASGTIELLAARDIASYETPNGIFTVAQSAVADDFGTVTIVTNDTRQIATLSN